MALITGGLTYLGIRKQASSNNEGIYADHLAGALNDVDKYRHQLEDQSKQTLSLQAKVERQTKLIEQQTEIINTLTQQVGELKEQLRKYMGDEEIGN